MCHSIYRIMASIAKTTLYSGNKSTNYPKETVADELQNSEQDETVKKVEERHTDTRCRYIRKVDGDDMWVFVVSIIFFQYLWHGVIDICVFVSLSVWTWMVCWVKLLNQLIYMQTQWPTLDKKLHPIIYWRTTMGFIMFCVFIFRYLMRTCFCEAYTHNSLERHHSNQCFYKRIKDESANRIYLILKCQCDIQTEQLV